MPSAFQTPAVPAGEHTLYVRAVDAQGLAGEVGQPFEVDLAQPGAQPGTITSGPPRYARSSFASFHFTVPAVTVATECAVDEAAFRPCSGSFATGYLLDGRHVFRLLTSDGTGAPAELDTVFTVDTLKPNITLGSARTTVGSSGSAAFSVTCPASEPGGCAGRLSLTTIAAKRGERARTILSQSWQAGPQVTLRLVVPVPPWALALALKRGGIADRLTVSAHNDAGNVTVLERTGRLSASASAVWRERPRGAASAPPGRTARASRANGRRYTD